MMPKRGQKRKVRVSVQKRGQLINFRK